MPKESTQPDISQEIFIRSFFCCFGHFTPWPLDLEPPPDICPTRVYEVTCGQALTKGKTWVSVVKE